MWGTVTPYDGAAMTPHIPAASRFTKEDAKASLLLLSSSFVSCCYSCDSEEAPNEEGQKGLLANKGMQGTVLGTAGFGVEWGSLDTTKSSVACAPDRRSCWGPCRTGALV